MHDHSATTHSADCDSCEYKAEVHAHDDESAVAQLSNNLAEHNKQEHGQETDPEEIKEPIRNKMQSHT